MKTFANTTPNLSGHLYRLFATYSSKLNFVLNLNIHFLQIILYLTF